MVLLTGRSRLTRNHQLMIVPRGLGGSKELSGGAVGLVDHGKVPDGDFTGTLSLAVAHDVCDRSVAAAAIRPCSRALADLFERAGSFERASANGSVRHGVAMANDHGDSEKQPDILEKDFQYHFQVSDFIN